MSNRKQNETKFCHWDELPGGGRRYWFDVPGRNGWHARYVKVVDAQDQTRWFGQEIRDNTGQLVEIHEKYPTDKGHQKGPGQ